MKAASEAQQLGATVPSMSDGQVVAGQVVALMNDTVSTILALAQEQRDQCPELAGHLERFSERLAGASLEVIIAWPRTGT